MKSIEVLALGVRLVGILFVLEVLEFVSSSYVATEQWMNSNPGEDTAIWLMFYGTIALVLLMMCFFMIKFPMIVSRWLLSKGAEGEPIFNGSIDDLRIAAFMIIGVYTLSWAIPDFFYNAGMLLSIGSQSMQGVYGGGAVNEIIVQEVVTVLEIIVGLYLCLQAKGLNLLLLKFRGISSS